ncbi:hypothetical protein [Acinetobacter sp.]|uniref:hypothetical protein n=1 Tax=Acinetobacter sp. TaxID=472 RepID=UPI00388D0107
MVSRNRIHTWEAQLDGLLIVEDATVFSWLDRASKSSDPAVHDAANILKNYYQGA